MGILECTMEFTVEPGHAAEHLAQPGVLSTPCLILFMEKTARICLERVLPEGKTSVGVRADVRHRRPVPVESVVEVRVRGMPDEDGYYIFTVRAYHGGVLVGEGVHIRKIVDRGFGQG